MYKGFQTSVKWDRSCCILGTKLKLDHRCLSRHNTVLEYTFLFHINSNRICVVSVKKRLICKDQQRRNQENACWNTKRIEKDSARQTYEEKYWSTRSYEEAQRTTLILAIESILLIKSQLISIICTITGKMHIFTITCRLGCGNSEDNYCIKLGFRASGSTTLLA